jgi:AmiR/NasT family two-component response regulator
MTFYFAEAPLPSTIEGCQHLIAQLRAALDSRAVIDQAKGMLIAQHGCSPDEAFAMLCTASMRENRKLRDIATAMVEGASPRCERHEPR